jgi:hypothetical protein
MSIVAFMALVSAAVPAEPERTPSRGVELASAQVRAVILRPAIVRQDEGLQDTGPEAPRPQVSRRQGTVLIEFE